MKALDTIIRRTKHLFDDPEYMLGKLWIKLFGANHTPDRLYLKVLFRQTMGYKLDLRHPKTFNEKLNWLKLYDRNPLYTTLVDKVAVKEWVAKIIGEQYVIPTLGVYNSFDEIEFDKLPHQFVLKCSHDSGSVVICTDKSTFDKEYAKRRLNIGLERNLYNTYREWPYNNVHRKIIAEQLLSDSTGELFDYKFFVFGGKTKCFKIDFDRFGYHGANYYDVKGNMLSIGEKICPPNYNRQIIIPHNINDMVAFSEILANNLPFLRVDFYNVNKRIYFGECTFYPGAGINQFIEYTQDELLGSWINLPNKH